VEARARSAWEATRRKISRSRSSVRAGGCRGDAVGSGRGRIDRAGDAINGMASGLPASDEERNGGEGSI
jgi:hypothetical protein